MILKTTGETWYFSFRLWEREPDLVHGFSSRVGGVSRGPYRSLNMGFHTGDKPTAVLENRRRFAGALGVDLYSFVAGRQVHGDTVALVDSPQKGLGATNDEDALESTDGLVTACRGICLVGFFADCVPLFFYDPSRLVVGLGHAGWKGTLGKIGAKVVAKMVDAFSSNPRGIWAGIGPAIGSCCYEVGPDLAERFGEAFGDGIIRRDGSSRFLDLKEINRRILIESGIPESNIVVSEWCTACRTDVLYSHRKQGEPTGRMAALIGLR